MSINIFQEKLAIQKSIVEYFGDAVMVKIKQIPETQTKPSYSLFYAKIGCMLCVEDRYIICVIEQDPYPLGFQQRLSEMNWISFQTRTIEKSPGQLKTQQLKSKMTSILSDKIKLSDKRTDRNVYMAATVPLKVELLYTKEDDTYADSGTIQSALDTYNCVLTFTI